MSVTRKNLSQDKSLWTIRIDGVPVVLGSKKNFLNKTDSRLLQRPTDPYPFVFQLGRKGAPFVYLFLARKVPPLHMY